MLTYQPNSTSTKSEVFQEVKSHIESLGFTIVDHDDTRPWGAFLVIDPNQIEAFQKHFFGEVSLSFESDLSYSPKILMVAPSQKLSWQYHYRRSELWKLVSGEAAIARSLEDIEPEADKMEMDELVKLAQGERHRLIGLEGWGVVAEIWVHTDPKQPSDESDIVRLQDDYARK
ncbi:cupin domain-containing protein [Belliella kenyensis]|uniref:Cupin domain-containing protein n=1 Tax=Belliella kenyensis TaxID=1472724 RepID=A0ABV8EQ26_9BACT|nr:phosphoheptose isomerase [Belliella kenyensis]MCH7402194.1 phosphoheptose isomerase [Belliella kenyensis]MDN3601709.1 phosphoheptose isomerase [Belliella kenyensis]